MTVGRRSIETTCGPSPLHSQARNPPACSSVTASQASPNTARYCHHNASARTCDFTVLGETS
ncbi:MAG: hypothetical protein ACRDRJ_33605 [Streptosporangiaceae bacterium]